MADPLDRLQGARASLAAKAPVRAMTTGNITLSGFQTVDGVIFASTDDANGYSARIAVNAQTDSTENGIYLVASDTWERTKDFDGNTDFIKGTLVYVTDGATNGGKYFTVSSADPQSVGENAISFSSVLGVAYDSLTVHGADIASASSINFTTATGYLIDVTGTATISTITLAEGYQRLVRFTGIATLVNSSSLVLPGGQSITTAAGDYALFVGYASSVVRCAVYTRKNGQSLTTAAATLTSGAPDAADLGSVIAQSITVSGTTTITSFGSSAPTGAIKFVTFSGALILTHDGTALILPGAANITTAAGDCIIARHEGSGNWRVISYLRGAGRPLNTGRSDTIGTGVGFAVTPYNLGTLSSGLTTLASTNGNMQYATVSGAISLAPQTAPSSIIVELTNSTTAAAVTSTAYTRTIGATSSSSTAKFLASSIVTQTYSLLQIQPLQ